MNILKRILSKDKPHWASVCTEVYKDKKGRRYYKYNDEMDMSIMRKGEIDKCLMELRYGQDFTDVLNAMKAAVNEFDKKGKAKPNITNIGYYIDELMMRDELLILPEILIKIAANTLIREDESAAVPDMEILADKVHTFKSELTTDKKLFNFFQSAGLLKLLGLSTTSITGLRRLIINCQERLKQFHSIMYISGPELQKC